MLISKEIDRDGMNSMIAAKAKTIVLTNNRNDEAKSALKFAGRALRNEEMAAASPLGAAQRTQAKYEIE